MKTWIAIFALSAMAFAAPADIKKKKTAAHTKPAAPAAQQIVIPKDATPNPDGSYSYTDKAGKKWLYNKTPFGISKMEDMGGSPSGVAASKQQYVKAIDNGDTVKFERQSPFGTTRWEKKKSDLTDDERALLQPQTPPQESPAQKPE